MLGVLDALAAAHAQGIVHRDLKPSNILVDADGRARVMDFGIAARVARRRPARQGRIVGTPGYMSPEAARGEAPVPAMDVFAAGLVLAEMLSGAPLLRERDPYARRAARAGRGPGAAAGLRAWTTACARIVLRALARDAGERYDGAGRHAPTRCATGCKPAADGGRRRRWRGHGTLEFLLRRMRHKSDFPALSDSVARIQRVATSDTREPGQPVAARS